MSHLPSPDARTATAPAPVRFGKGPAPATARGEHRSAWVCPAIRAPASYRVFPSGCSRPSLYPVVRRGPVSKRKS